MSKSRLKDLRLKNGYKTQKDLADALFVNQTAVSQWERGVTIPSGPMLFKLSELFGESIDYILGGKEIKTPTPEDEDGLDPELVALIKQIPADRMPEVERYLRFQAEQEEKP